jgi:hypothetical protein
MLTVKASRRRRIRTIVAAGVAVVGLAIGLVLFKPWLLFVDVRVDEPLPTVATATVQAQPSPVDSSPASAVPSAVTSSAAVPSAPAATGPVQLAAGSLISHEHTTSGTVRIIKQPDGVRVLTLADLDTSNGPDVHVWLSAAHVVEGTGGWFTAGSADHYDLGIIKGNQGNQVYEIPADVDLSKYKSVDLWCVQFSVSFGAAELSP